MLLIMRNLTEWDKNNTESLYKLKINDMTKLHNLFIFSPRSKSLEKKKSKHFEV